MSGILWMNGSYSGGKFDRTINDTLDALARWLRFRGDDEHAAWENYVNALPVLGPDIFKRARS